MSDQQRNITVFVTGIILGLSVALHSTAMRLLVLKLSTATVAGLIQTVALTGQLVVQSVLQLVATGSCSATNTARPLVILIQLRSLLGLASHIIAFIRIRSNFTTRFVSAISVLVLVFAAISYHASAEAADDTDCTFLKSRNGRIWTGIYFCTHIIILINSMGYIAFEHSQSVAWRTRRNVSRRFTGYLSALRDYQVDSNGCVVLATLAVIVTNMLLRSSDAPIFRVIYHALTYIETLASLTSTTNHIESTLLKEHGHRSGLPIDRLRKVTPAQTTAKLADGTRIDIKTPTLPSPAMTPLGASVSTLPDPDDIITPSRQQFDQ